MGMTKREKLLLLVCLIVIIAASVYKAESLPVIGKAITLKRDINERREVLERYLNTAGRGDIYYSNVVRNIEKVGLLESRLYKGLRPQEIIIDMLKAIDDVAKAQGVTIRSKRQLPSIETEYAVKYPVELEFSSSPSQIERFLNTFMQKDRFFGIERLSLDLQETSKNLTLRITLYTLAAKDDSSDTLR